MQEDASAMPRNRRRCTRANLPFLETYHTHSGWPARLEERQLLAGTLAVSWIGQDNLDLVGTTPAVGSDTLQDIHIRLGNLAPSPVVTVKVDGPIPGLSWGSGPNTNGRVTAELVRQSSPGRSSDTTTTAELYLGALSSLQTGQALTVTLTYGDGSTSQGSVTVGAFSASLAAVATATVPRAPVAVGQGIWLGQYASDRSTSNANANAHLAGDIHAAVDRLPSGQSVATIARVIISNEAGHTWDSLSPANRSEWLTVLAPASRDRPELARAVDLYFPAVRNESNATLTIRFIYRDGSSSYARMAGGSSDPTLRDTKVNATSAPLLVSPAGPDLVSYVDPRTGKTATASLSTLLNTSDAQGRFDRIQLSAGTYISTTTIHLNKAVQLSTNSGATILFQFNSAQTYQGGFAIHASHVEFKRFAIRFSGAVRFGKVDPLGGGYDPGVITSDNAWPKVGIAIEDLNIVGPAVVPDASNPSLGNVGADSGFLIRMGDNDSGRIAGNMLRGGITDVRIGPWDILDNEYVGAIANTHAEAVFAAHYTHDLTVRGNVAHLVQPTNPDGSKGTVGPAYRFLILDRESFQPLVEGNTITGGIGERTTDDRRGGPPNAPEVIVTESYQPHFEGKPSAISSDGMILTIGTLRGEPARTGFIVAILDGPYAGQYRRIAQALDSQRYLMDDPLPSGSYTISLAQGFTDSIYRNNTIDLRGLMSTGIVLTGNNFGTKILQNSFLGGDRFLIDGNGNPITGRAIRVEASSTENPPENPASFQYPAPWGWSHGAILGLVIDGNSIADSLSGINVQLTHANWLRPTDGRVYLTGSITRTRFSYSSSFLATSKTPELITLGTPGFWTSTNSDGSVRTGTNGPAPSGEMVVNVQGNWTSLPTGASSSLSTMSVYSSVLNGRPTTNSNVSIPAVAPGSSGLEGFAIGQDGSDMTGYYLKAGATSGTYTVSPADGLQDLHLALVGLRTDVGISAIQVYPYGYNHYEWTLGKVTNLTLNVSRSPGTSTADLFLQTDPNRPENGTNHYDVLVQYADGTSAGTSIQGILADSTLKNSRPLTAVEGDVTGDGRAEIVAFRPSTSDFSVLAPSINYGFIQQFGQGGTDVPINGDFDGDGRADIAVYRPTTSQWFYIRSSDAQGVADQLGQGGVDLPVPADYDGDGITDLAVWRPSTSVWYVRGTSSNVPALAFGQSGDIPVPGKYEGGSVSELAVFRPSTGTFLILARDGTTREMAIAGVKYTYQSGDVPIPGDFDGDGRTDLAVYRKSTAQWFISPADGGTGRIMQFGQPGLDLPAARDYDGDGKLDFAVFRPTTATWYIAQTMGGPIVWQFGRGGSDIPIAAPDLARPKTVSIQASRGAASLGASTPVPVTTTTSAPTNATVVIPQKAGSTRVSKLKFPVVRNRFRLRPVAPKTRSHQ